MALVATDVQNEVREDLVTIPKIQYTIMREKALLLTALESAGVDSWQGYEDALQIFEFFKSEDF